MATIMRKGYPIGTKVLVGGLEHTISAVSFYPNHEKYLLYRIDEGKIIEDWFSEFYFDAGLQNTKKIGFEV